MNIGIKKTRADLRRLKKSMRKVEIKEFIVTAATGTGGALTKNVSVTNVPIAWMPTFNPPSGDDSNSRVGNKIMVKWIKIRMKVATTNNEGMRIQFISPKTGSATVSLTAVPVDFRAVNYVDTIYNNHIIKVDRSFYRTMSNTGVLVPTQFHNLDYKIPVNKEWLFDSGTTSVPSYAPGILQINFVGTSGTLDVE